MSLRVQRRPRQLPKEVKSTDSGSRSSASKDELGGVLAEPVSALILSVWCSLSSALPFHSFKHESIMRLLLLAARRVL